MHSNLEGGTVPASTVEPQDLVVDLLHIRPDHELRRTVEASDFELYQPALAFGRRE